MCLARKAEVCQGCKERVRAKYIYIYQVSEHESISTFKNPQIGVQGVGVAAIGDEAENVSEAQFTKDL